jgi:hypothetical protein
VRDARRVIGSRSVAAGFLVLAFILLAASACAGTPPPTDTAVAQKLEELKTESLVRLAELTDFVWDRAYFFDSYTSADDVNAESGGDILPGWQSVPENEDLLVFALAGKPIRVVHTPIWSLALTEGLYPTG